MKSKCCDKECIVKQVGPHIGAYCSKCGKWQKWLSKRAIDVTSAQLNNFTEQYDSKVDNFDIDLPW